MPAQVISADQAAALVQDGQTLGVQGIICTSVAEDLIQALAARHRQTGRPDGITLFCESGIGDNADGGLNALARPGLIGALHCGHLGTAPKMAQLVAENRFPAFIVPQGVNAQLVRAQAGGKPGVVTSVGLGTYADPRVEGCLGNQAARDSGHTVVELTVLDGQEYLRYRPRPIDVCFIRATSADQAGNLSIERESIRFDQLEMATATRNSGGLVIAQVERLVQRGSLDPHRVVIPGLLVDYVVVADPAHHRQCLVDQAYHPEWSGEARLPWSEADPAPLDERKVCGRRAALLLRSGQHVNLGIGIAESVSAVAAEEGLSDDIAMSVEAGIYGGVPLGGLRICSAHNPECIISQVATFDLYDGGGIDLAVLGAAEIDRFGNVNVSRFSGRVVGPGGFVNISQSTPKVAFVGLFTAGGNQYQVGQGQIQILREGRHPKFKPAVEQITFSGRRAVETGQEVWYITERAVFRLTADGVELVEIAPGVDLTDDVLAQMEFTPQISDDLKLMDHRIFSQAAMGLTL
ncbi:MAG: malonate decarboxylase subunit alpha [Propionibacteriaceae bacterium]|jgi:propionate CoA-transferase|nr:malonate decarboxylase subunit alpha [Propionibacteriaceae bacterium]